MKATKVISDAEFEKEELRAKLQGSFLLFTRVFYKLLTARDFRMSVPIGRESHFVTVARELVRCSRLECTRLVINIPPGHGKSTMLAMWVAWTMSMYPDSRFLYISYSHTLSSAHTDTIRQIMMLREYRDMFGVELRSDSKAKDFFQTTAGGAVGAFGSSGSITGRDAGLPGQDRFTGALIIDDAHKPDEVFSDTVREGVINNYKETIQQRIRSMNVPMIFIGQRLHEADLPAYLLSGEDGFEWERVILQSIDGAGNALYPEAFPLDFLRIQEEKNKYVFSSQHQQNPAPAGDGLFSPTWFVELDTEPEFKCTFITADTAETDKTYNDATVFSFWGIYEIESFGRKTGEMGIHWIDCLEIRVEPKDLKETFLDFYADCTTHHTPPLIAAIEKKSTGVTLVSVLQELRGMSIRAIERNRSSGSKTQRFIEIQPFIAARKVSFSKYAKHKDMCINHMSKITANDAHRHDDIADTLADAIRLAFIEKALYSIDKKEDEKKEIFANMNRSLQKRIKVGAARNG